MIMSEWWATFFVFNSVISEWTSIHGYNHIKMLLFLYSLQWNDFTMTFAVNGNNYYSKLSPIRLLIRLFQHFFLLIASLKCARTFRFQFTRVFNYVGMVAYIDERLAKHVYKMNCGFFALTSDQTHETWFFFFAC